MGNVWLKIKVWTKIGIFVLALIYLIIFIYNNSGQPLKVWVWFGHQWDTSALEIIPTLLVAGAVGIWLIRMAIRTVRQIKQIRMEDLDVQTQKDVADLKAKAGMLQTKPVATAQEPQDPPAK
jgi:hypothetical protein